MTVLPEGQELKLVWQILVLDYLSSECERPQAGFRSFADFPDVRGYLQVFDGRVVQRLARTVGKDKGQFASAAERCEGVRGTDSPLTYLFHLFPRFEIQVVRDEGDEDFPTSFNLLLPDNATAEKRRWASENSLLKRIGTPEDVANTVLFLAEMDFVTGAVYFMDGGRALV